MSHYLLPQWIDAMRELREDMVTSARAVRAFAATPHSETLADISFIQAMAALDDALQHLCKTYDCENPVSEERDEPRKMPTDGWATS